jgi:hypothetical protein
MQHAGCPCGIILNLVLGTTYLLDTGNTVLNSRQIPAQKQSQFASADHNSRTKRIQAFCAALKEKLRARASNFGKEYLKRNQSVQKEVRLSGTYAAMRGKR